MQIVRPIQRDDLGDLLALAHRTDFGLTTLPPDEAHLARRIEQSLAGEALLFVLRDTDTGRLLGTSGIVTRTGTDQPFYSYRLETTVRESRALGVRQEVRVLHLMADRHGPSELGTLFLDPAFRRGGSGRLLSLARFLYVAQHREQFDQTLIVELRGVIDRRGRSPFWDALGQVFFRIDYPTADRLSAIDKRFIAELMPEHPIYIPLLPASARDVIGRVHPDTEPAQRMLQAEGFAFIDRVDIFDAGPTLACPTAEVRAVRDSRAAVVAALTPLPEDAPRVLIATDGPAFRAAAGRVAAAEDGVTLEPAVAEALGVGVGDTVRSVAPRPTPPAAPGAAG